MGDPIGHRVVFALTRWPPRRDRSTAPHRAFAAIFAGETELATSAGSEASDASNTSATEMRSSATTSSRIALSRASIAFDTSDVTVQVPS